MPDFTLCKSQDCDKRAECKRAQKYPDNEYQAYCDFLNHVPDFDDRCPWLMPLKGDDV